MTPRDTFYAARRMAQLAIMHRELAFVTRDKSGGWRHRYRKGVIVSPRPRQGSWKQNENLTYDLFCHEYTPTEGDVVVDVGAGWGTEVVTMSRLVGAAGRVIAVEASPAAAGLLWRTVEENRLTNVTIVESAVAHQNGVVHIDERGGAGDIRNTLFSTEGHTHEVPSLTLDTLVEREGLTGIDLLKVNIEGAEKLMVQGMTASANMVRHAVISCHDFIADETGDDDFRSREVVHAALEQMGFSVRRHPDDPRPYARDYLYATRSAD